METEQDAPAQLLTRQRFSRFRLVIERTKMLHSDLLELADKNGQRDEVKSGDEV